MQDNDLLIKQKLRLSLIGPVSLSDRFDLRGGRGQLTLVEI